MPGATVAEVDNGLFRSAVSTLQAKSLAIEGASERARWPSEIFRPARVRLSGTHCARQSAAAAGLWPTLLSIAARSARAGRPCIGDRAGGGGPAVLTDAEASGIKSATVYASMMGDGEEPESKARGAWLENFVATSRLRVAGPNCMGAYSYRERLLGGIPTPNCAGSRPARSPASSN